jgi:hypothetical protein
MLMIKVAIVLGFPSALSAGVLEHWAQGNLLAVLRHEIGGGAEGQLQSPPRTSGGDGFGEGLRLELAEAVREAEAVHAD